MTHLILEADDISSTHKGTINIVLLSSQVPPIPSNIVTIVSESATNETPSEFLHFSRKPGPRLSDKFSWIWAYAVTPEPGYHFTYIKSSIIS